MKINLKSEQHYCCLFHEKIKSPQIHKDKRLNDERPETEWLRAQVASLELIITDLSAEVERLSDGAQRMQNTTTQYTIAPLGGSFLHK